MNGSYHRQVTSYRRHLAALGTLGLLILAAASLLYMDGHASAGIAYRLELIALGWLILPPLSFGPRWLRRPYKVWHLAAVLALVPLAGLTSFLLGWPLLDRAPEAMRLSLAMIPVAAAVIACIRAVSAVASAPDTPWDSSGRPVEDHDAAMRALRKARMPGGRLPGRAAV